MLHLKICFPREYLLLTAKSKQSGDNPASVVKDKTKLKGENVKTRLSL